MTFKGCIHFLKDRYLNTSTPEAALMSVIRFGYLIPIFVVILFTSITGSTGMEASAARMAVVLLLCLGCGVYAFSQRHAMLDWLKNHRALSINVLLALVMIGVSVILNNPPLADFARAFVQSSYIFVIALIIPFLLRGKVETRQRLADEVVKTMEIFVGLTVFLVVLAIYWQAMGYSYNPSLVHPVDPSKWIWISWMFAFVFWRYRLLSLILAVALIWTASRSLILCMMLSYFYFSICVWKTSWKKMAKEAGCVLLALLTLHCLLPASSPFIVMSRNAAVLTGVNLQAYVMQEGARITPISKDVFSNREEIYKLALRKFDKMVTIIGGAGGDATVILPKAPLVQTANEAQPQVNASEKAVAVRQPDDAAVKAMEPSVSAPKALKYKRSDKRLRAEKSSHNAFLRLALLYGAPFAVFSYVIFFILFCPSRKMPQDKGEKTLRQISWFFFGAMLFQSIFFTTFWTNMADPPVFVTLLWLLAFGGRAATAPSIPAFRQAAQS